MKKITFLYSVHLFILCLLLSDGFAQEYAAKWHLPEGAKARLGRGKLNNVIFSPDGTRIAISTPIGIWVYDAQTRETVSLFAEIQTGETEKFLPSKSPEPLVFSADAVLVASAHGKSIYVWDTATGTAFAKLDEHPDSIKAIALSPDSTKLATAGGDWTVRLWDVGTGKYINSLTGRSSAVTAIAFSPDGKTLAGAGITLRLWDADTGELLHADSKDLGSVNQLVFSPDGKRLASSGGGWDRTVHLWDANTGTPQKSLKGHTGVIRDMAFSSDSSTLVSVSSDAMRLWDVNTGVELKSLPTPEDKPLQPVPSVLKGEQVERAILPNYRDSVYSVTFSKDAAHLISVSKDGGLHVWDVETGFYQTSFSLGAHSDLVSVLAFSEDSGYLANNDGFEGRVRIWNVENATQHAVLTLERGIFFNELTISPSIKKLAGRDFDGTIRIWDAATAEQLSAVPTDPMPHQWRLVFSPDGQILAGGGGQRFRSQKIELWQADPGIHLSTLEGHALAVTDYTFSPDSEVLASGGEDASIILWDVATGKQLTNFIGHTRSISALAFSADGKTLASGSVNGVRLWDVQGGDLIATLDAVKDVEVLALSPDGKTLASGSKGDQIEVWNLAPTPQIRSTFTGHQGSVYVLMFSPDGKTLASAGNDGTVLLWDMER